MSVEKSNGLSSILWIIVVLLIIIIGQNFYYGINKDTNNNKNISVEKKDTNSDKNEEASESIEVTFISDKRCTAQNCQLGPIVEQLKKIPWLANTNIITLDYSDKEAKKIIELNDIKKLPAWIFSNNKITELTSYLTETKSWNYSLELGASFDPTAKRSDKWFLVLGKKVLEEIKNNSYLKWYENAKITWLEYSDLECPFCAKLHNSGTPEELEKKYGKDLNQYFQSFPLDFHKNALPWAEALECLAKEKWSKAYYKLKDISFKEKKSDKDFLIEEAVKLGANKDTITKCIDDKTFSAKINKQQETGSKEFGVTGTPWNVLINNETGEYEVISGAYPTSAFVEIIDKLLK